MRIEVRNGRNGIFEQHTQHISNLRQFGPQEFEGYLGFYWKRSEQEDAPIYDGQPYILYLSIKGKDFVEVYRGTFTNTPNDNQ